MKNKKTFTFTRAAMTLLLMMLTTMTAWADDVNLSEDNDIAVGTAGHYYVNMPSGTVTNTLTITADDIAAGKGTFKVYDNGGKGGLYSTNCTGILVLTAPEGYILELSGDITTETNWDKLTVYDNNEASGTTLLNEKSSTSKGVKTSIGTVTSTSNVMTIKFYSDGSGTYDGLDLTVTVVDPNADYVINGLGPATGGSIAASVGGNNATTAKVADVVTLTANPGSSYVLSGISVTDASNNDIVVTWDGPFSNTATFTMPASVVTVTPTFSNNISVNMPKTDSKYVTIPSDVQTFKVYDDGGKDGNYSDKYEGTLVLTASEGHKIRLSGSITLESYDKLTVYDNNEASGTKLLDAVSSSSSGTKTDITTFTSTGDITSTDNVMTIYFKSDGLTNFDGLDLTVMVFNPNADYNVTINTAEGGSVTANPTSAKVNETITLTATPDNTYVLSGISVTDASSNPVAVTGGKWYDNTASFTMPGSDVTVTPTFTDNMTDLSVNMPVTEDQIVEIPAGVESFKVYDDGGKDNVHSQNCTGTLVLTAPENHLLRLSGKITTDPYDYLTVYDGSKENGSKLLNEVRSTSSGTETDIVPVTSKGNVMTIYFYTNNFYEEAGLDLTVTVVNPNMEYNVNVINPAEGGSVTASPTSAKVNETVTLTATPASGYLLSGISVTDAGSNPVAVTWDGPLDNTVTFTMPGSNVTITPTFTDNLTADGGLYINMPTTNNNYNELTIPSGIRSFKVYDDGGENGTYSNNYEGTLVLTAPEGYVLQLSGGITTESADKLTVYDNSEASGTKLIDAMGGIGSTKKDIEPVTSTGNAMTIYFKSDFSMTYAGLDLTVTLFKNIAACDITVPNQTLEGPDNPFDNISYKFEYVNNNYSEDSAQDFIESMDVVVKDGETGLQIGTDFLYGSVTMANGDPIQESAIGDECKVEIIGRGNYAGSKWKTFKIVAPDAGGKWGDNNELTWAFHDGTLTISPTENVQTPVAMKKAAKGEYPWFSVANYIQTITIGEGVSTMADDAFNRVTESNVYGNVNALNLPTTLTTIGEYAFAYCTGLTVELKDFAGITYPANAFTQVGCVVGTLLDNANNANTINVMEVATTNKVTLQGRTLQTGSWNTFAVPFNAAIPDGWTVKKLTNATVEGSTVVLTFSNAESIEAGKPYLVQVTSAVENPVFNNVSVSSTPAPSVFDGVISFVPTFGLTKLPSPKENILFLATGNTLKHPSAEGQKLKGFRAYFQLPGGANQARSIRLDLGENVTGVEMVQGSRFKVQGSDGATYNLNGQKVSDDYKGIVIKNGRKIAK